MTSADWTMVIAIILAPLVAVQVQKYLEKLRDKRARRLNLFRTLMATRAAKVSPAHVEALNMIDIEYYGNKIFRITSRSKSEKSVVDTWKVYLDHLNTLGPSPSESKLQAWSTKGDDLLADLLYEMANSLGYDFDKVHLKRGIYSPLAHEHNELYQRFVRDAVLRILTAQQPLFIAPWRSSDEAQGADNPPPPNNQDSDSP